MKLSPYQVMLFYFGTVKINLMEAEEPKKTKYFLDTYENL